MGDILNDIAAYKRKEIESAKRMRPPTEVETKARAADPPRGFLGAIERRLQADLATPQKKGSGPLAMPLSFLRQA